MILEGEISFPWDIRLLIIAFFFISERGIHF